MGTDLGTNCLQRLSADKKVAADKKRVRNLANNENKSDYNPFLDYCRELAPGTVRLTGDRAQGDDSKHDSHYKYK